MNLPAAAGKQPTILVVDDSAIIRHLIGEVLKEEFSLVMASSGEEGLQLIESHKPDLILTDYLMPGMSGIDLVKNYRSQKATSDIPSIIITSSNEPIHLSYVGERVVDDIIQKPFSKLDLIEKISNALNKNKIQESTYHSINRNNFQMNGNKQSFEEKINQIILAEIKNPDLKVGHLANGLSMSVSSFERYMKKYFGMNPKLYVRKFRMEYAMHLLKNNNWKIKKVARSVGFENDSYFAKCFRDRFGYNPSDIDATLSSIPPAHPGNEPII